MIPGNTNRLLRRLAPCVVLLWATLPAGADETSYRFHRQFAEDSSLISDVLHLAQDPQGFVWFTQNRTLHRYDGTRVLTVAALKRDQFTALTSDLAGNLWLGTDTSGLQVWEASTQRLEPWLPPQGGFSFANNITALTVDGDGFLWAASSGGRVARIDPKSRKAEVFGPSDLDPTEPRPVSISALLTTRSGDIWIGSLEGKIFRRRTGATEFDAVDVGADWNIVAMAESRGGEIWVGARNGRLARVRAESLALIPPTLRSDAEITALVEDPQGHLWIGTDLGVKILQPESSRFEPIHTDPESPDEPSTDRVRTLFLDQSGLVWIAAGDAGVSTTSTRASAFKQWQPRDRGPTAPVMAITVSQDGSLWVGTYEDGLIRRSPLGAMRHYGRD